MSTSNIYPYLKEAKWKNLYVSVFPSFFKICPLYTSLEEPFPTKHIYTFYVSLVTYLHQQRIKFLTHLFIKTTFSFDN